MDMQTAFEGALLAQAVYEDDLAILPVTDVLDGKMSGSLVEYFDANFKIL